MISTKMDSIGCLLTLVKWSLILSYGLFSVYGVYTAWKWKNSLPMRVFLGGVVFLSVALVLFSLFSSEIISGFYFIAGTLCVYGLLLMLPSYGVIGLASRLQGGGMKKTLACIALMVIYFASLTAPLIYLASR